MTEPISISAKTARRYVLGKQGLFPGRRFSGKAGLEAAFREIEAVQIDPISYFARSHDLSLLARVEKYDSAHLDLLLHTERRLFDYGTILMIYPAEDLPFLAAIMKRRWEALQKSERVSPELRRFVLQEIELRGALSGRDFTGRERIRGGFNTVKDTSAALYHLWLSGLLLSHSRNRSERRHDLFERVAGKPFEEVCAPLAEAEAHFFRKSLRELGLCTPAEWTRNVVSMLGRRPSPPETREVFQNLLEENFLFPLKIEGLSSLHYALSGDRPLLDTLEKGLLPTEWKTDHSTETEAAFLAPLDSVIWDRARTRSLFGFDYLWEVYKPAPARKWGYYTLPVLYGDTLAGRAALKLDRKTSAVLVEGEWTEPGFENNLDYRAAVSAGLERLKAFTGAAEIKRVQG